MAIEYGLYQVKLKDTRFETETVWKNQFISEIEEILLKFAIWEPYIDAEIIRQTKLSY